MKRTLSPLKLARLKTGYTCADLARELGISRTHLTLVENGRRTPSPALRDRLAALLIEART